MILKKPYAFLIKYFKIIHILLAILLGYLAFKINDIVRFFNDFVKSGFYSSLSGLANEYINLLMYFAVILILAITIFIYLLMRYKKKSTKFYVALISYYLFIFVILSVTFGIFQTLEKGGVDAQLARLYRDLSLLISLPQYFFIIYTLMRGLGFNLKKFNFQLDLKEMEINQDDDEEIELNIDVDTYKAKRYVRRSFREFKYYVIENTFFFTIIVSVIGVILSTVVFLNVNVYNKVYKENKVFTHKTFNLKINNSYLSNTDYKGKTLVSGKYYLILDINIVNKSASSALLKLNDFHLKINDDNIYPTKNKINSFTDIGTPYKGDKLKGGTMGDYILVFELDEENVRSSYTLKLLDSITYEVGDIKTKYKTIKLTPQKLNKVENVGTYKQQEKISLKDSILKNSTLSITSYDITKTYEYNYNFCIEENCRISKDIVTPNYNKGTGNTLLVLDYKLSLDKQLDYTKELKNESDFFSHFVKIRYVLNDKEYIDDIVNLTPDNLEDKIVLQVNEKIRQSKDVELIITIRNKEYRVTIK